MSLEKKIMFNNWVKPCGFPRERIERFLDQPERHSKHSLKRNHKLCKRNGLREHEYKVINLPHHGSWSSWVDYECIHCGKREYIVTWSQWPSNLEYNQKKLSKMKIVE